MNTPVVINSYADFERQFGGLWVDSTLSYAVRDYYLNGGSQAIIVRIENGAAKATIEAAGGLKLRQRSGAVGRKAAGPRRTSPQRHGALQRAQCDTGSGAEETFLNISTDSAPPRSLSRVLDRSSLLELNGAAPGTRPTKNVDVPLGTDPFADTAPANSFTQAKDDGDDGNDLTDAQYQGTAPPRRASTRCSSWRTRSSTSSASRPSAARPTWA
ncbi:MAG: hypothetical protein R2838_24950 [Caldilineaceae bacterium]